MRKISNLNCLCLNIFFAVEYFQHLAHDASDTTVTMSEVEFTIYVTTNNGTLLFLEFIIHLACQTLMLLLVTVCIETESHYST